MSIITLLTDFGGRDTYVGVMHGVIHGINPRATVVDLCHEVPPQDLRTAAFHLATAYRYFPAEAIHVVVVDPGVGSARRAMAVRASHGTFVAPDNGLLSPVLAREPVEAIVELSNPEFWLMPVSATFHGRDVFAPVAAHLSLGVPLDRMGPRLDHVERWPESQPRRLPDGSLAASIQHVDRFGNLVTNVPAETLSNWPAVRVRVAGTELTGPLEAYSTAQRGELLVIVGSHGYLELAMRDGSAAASLGLRRQDEVLISPIGPPERKR